MLLRNAQPWYARILREEQGEGGEGGGGQEGGEGGGDDINNKIAAATAGLKANNDKLLEQRKRDQASLKALQDQVEAIGGADGIKRLEELHERLQKDELGKLLAEGKSDEWFEKRSEAMRQSHANQLEGMQTKLDEALAGQQGAIDKLHSFELENETTSVAAKSGVLPGAIGDISLRVQNEFQFDAETGRHVMKDAGGAIVFGKDAVSPMGVAEWLEGQKETSRHWWPVSQGGGAGGSGNQRGGGGGGAKDLRDLPPDEFQKEFKKQYGGG